MPDHESCDGSLTAAARWLLYVRAHYLRMPLPLLLPHLLRKSLHRPDHSRENEAQRTLQARVEELLRLTPRSEEHTSELQSLMRISYAVFCLKKKTRLSRSTTVTRRRTAT